MSDKPRFALVSDAAEVASLQTNGKFREGKPHWVLRAGQTWVLIDDAWVAWKALRDTAGTD